MSFSAYNLKNQKLSSDNLRTLLQFCSDNYAGAIYSNTGENPININGGTISFNANEVDFIVGGYLLHYNGQDAPIGNVTLGSDSPNKLFGIVINQTAIENSNKITSNSIENVYVGLISEINGKSVLRIYKSDANDSYTIDFGDESWVYKEDTKVFNSVTLLNSGTIDGENIYIIPLAAITTANEVVQLLGYRTKSALEEYLSENALSSLKLNLENTFTWRTGGELKGDIGDLNITDNIISSKTDVIQLDSDLNLGSNKANKVLMTDNNGNVVADVVTVDKGGTGGTDKNTAKNYLGIYWGSTLPSASSYQDGDIFLKVIN